MVKTITDATGRTLKMGRNRPVANSPGLRFSRYLLKNVPSAPDCDYSKAAMGSLSKMYMNDTLGCCVISGLEHMFGVFNANAGGNQAIFTNWQTIKQYGAIGGYNPNAPLVNGVNPTDQGCDEQTAMNHVVQYTMCGHSALGWMYINGADKDEVRLAMYLFENLVFGLELPDPWISPSFPSSNGFTWDVAGAPDPNNGHCVIGAGANGTGIQISTWGLVGTMTYAAVSQYTANSLGGELYAMISHEAIDKASYMAPNGIGWKQLQADFAALQK